MTEVGNLGVPVSLTRGGVDSRLRVSRAFVRGGRKVYGMHLLEVMNPVARQRAMENVAAINPRLDRLDGKTIGLVWSGTHGGDVALNRVGEMLKERFGEVETRFYTGGNYPNPPHILRQAADECDAVIGATGD